MVRPNQEVEVHFAYGSTNFQHVYALGDLLQTAIAEAKVGEYDGHAIPADGSDGKYFVAGPDAEAIYKAIAPILEASPLMRGASVTLHYGPAQALNSQASDRAGGIRTDWNQDAHRCYHASPLIPTAPSSHSL